jgi:hypothetical protein
VPYLDACGMGELSDPGNSHAPPEEKERGGVGSGVLAPIVA